MKTTWLLLVLVTLVAGRRNEEKSGPFRSVLLSVNRCQNSTYPLDQDTPLYVYMSVGNEVSSDPQRIRLLNGNVTVIIDTKQVRLKLKNFGWDGGRWRLRYLINVASCSGKLLAIICRAVNFDIFDVETCSFLKGTNSFHNMDINRMQHLFSSTMEYGRLLWRSEINGGMITYQCWEFQTLVERA